MITHITINYTHNKRSWDYIIIFKNIKRKNMPFPEHSTDNIGFRIRQPHQTKLDSLDNIGFKMNQYSVKLQTHMK